MKKIVFLRKNPNSVGGAEKYLSRLQRALKERFIPSSVRTYDGSDKLSSALQAILYNAQVKKQKKEDEFYFSLERVENADIYRAGDGVHKVYMKSKKFWFLNPLNFVYPYLEKKCFQNCKKIITNSNFIKEQIIKTYNINPDKIVTIYNGVNIPAKTQNALAKVKMCEKFGLDIEKHTIIFVGTGFKRKGVTEFLNIISNLKNSVNSIVVGKDKELDKYIKKAKSLGLNTLFVGEQKNVSDFYEAGDIFLFPTHYEPFSNVVLEAMAYSCIAITTKQNGASEILNEKFVMQNPNDMTICKIIDELLENEEKMQKEKEKNFKQANEFNIQKNAELTLKVINEYIN